MATLQRPFNLDRSAALFGGLALLLGALAGMVATTDDGALKLVVICAGLLTVAATIARLDWGLLVLLFITYTRFSDVAVHEHGLPSIAQPFVLLLLLLVVGRWVLKGQPPQGLRTAVLLLTGYGLVRFASLLYAADVGLALGTLVDYFKDVIIAVLIVMLLQRPQLLRPAIWALLAAGIFLGSLSVFQYVTGTFERPYWGFALSEKMHIIGETNDYRIAGPVGDPNFYAQIILPLVPLAIERLRGERRWRWRLLALWAVSACILTLMLTFSRGAFVALGAMLGLLAWRFRPQPRFFLLGLLLAIPLLQLAPENYVQRMRTLLEVLPGIEKSVKEEVSFRGRASEVAAARQMFLDRPLLGVGLNNYPVYYQQYSRQLGLDPRREARKPHSLFLEIASETGLLGIVSFGGLLWLTYRGMRRARQRLASAGWLDEANMVTALSIGITGYLIASIFLHAAYPRFLWVLIGLALATPQLARNALRQHAAAPDPGLQQQEQAYAAS